MDNVCALICEYNPFHYGHKFQLQLLKQKFKYVICIMSGTLVQRGEIALFNKYDRAAAAVNAGADIVLELPFPFSSLGAADFAQAGVHIAGMLGIPFLAFGAEDDENEKIAEYLLSDEFKKNITEIQKTNKNLSYPKLREMLIKNKLGEKYVLMIKKPNNILAVEYISAIKKWGYNIKTYSVERNLSFESSTAIRNKDFSELKMSVPEEMKEFCDEQNSYSIKNIERSIIADLRKKEIDEINSIYDVNFGFAARIKKAAINSVTLEELYNNIQSSTDTISKVKRAVINAYFNVKKEYTKEKPSYTLLLAANKNSLNILNEAKQSDLKILSKPSHYLRHSENLKSAFKRELVLEDIAAITCNCAKYGGEAIKSSPVIF